MDGRADGSGTRQALSASPRPGRQPELPGEADRVPVNRREEAEKRTEGATPFRLPEIVARAIGGAVEEIEAATPILPGEKGAARVVRAASEKVRRPQLDPLQPVHHLLPREPESGNRKKWKI